MRVTAIFLDNAAKKVGMSDAFDVPDGTTVNQCVEDAFKNALNKAGKSFEWQQVNLSDSDKVDGSVRCFSKNGSTDQLPTSNQPLEFY